MIHMYCLSRKISERTTTHYKYITFWNQQKKKKEEKTHRKKEKTWGTLFTYQERKKTDHIICSGNSCGEENKMYLSHSLSVVRRNKLTPLIFCSYHQLHFFCFLVHDYTQLPLKKRVISLVHYSLILVLRSGVMPFLRQISQWLEYSLRGKFTDRLQELEQWEQFHLVSIKCSLLMLESWTWGSFDTSCSTFMILRPPFCDPFWEIWY